MKDRDDLERGLTYGYYNKCPSCGQVDCVCEYIGRDAFYIDEELITICKTCEKETGYVDAVYCDECVPIVKCKVCGKEFNDYCESESCGCDRPEIKLEDLF